MIHLDFHRLLTDKDCDDIMFLSLSGK